MNRAIVIRVPETMASLNEDVPGLSLEFCLSKCKEFFSQPGSKSQFVDHPDFEYFMITFMGDYPLYEKPSPGDLYRKLISHEFKVSWEKRYSNKEMLQIIHYRLQLLDDPRSQLDRNGEKCWQYLCKHAGIKDFSQYNMDADLNSKLSKRSLFLEAFVFILKRIPGAPGGPRTLVIDKIKAVFFPGERIDTPMSLASGLIGNKCDDNPRPFVKVLRESSSTSFKLSKESYEKLTELEETADIIQGKVF